MVFKAYSHMPAGILGEKMEVMPLRRVSVWHIRRTELLFWGTIQLCGICGSLAPHLEAESFMFQCLHLR